MVRRGVSLLYIFKLLQRCTDKEMQNYVRDGDYDEDAGKMIITQ